jgi:hypothetical protein
MINQGYYPTDAKLYLDPTGYTTGGVELGGVLSAGLSTIAYDIDTITNHATGSTPTGASIDGVMASYMVQMRDYSKDIVRLLSAKTSDGESLFDLGSYKLGNLLPNNNFSRLVIRPVKNNGEPDLEAPFLFFPKALCIGGFNPTYDKRIEHTAGFVIQIMGFLAAGFKSPVFYGDVGGFPEWIM